MNRGTSRERQVKHWLEDRDWIVFRAAGSLGEADLVALKAGHRPRLVQVKATSRGGPFQAFGPRERAALLLAAEISGADAYLVWYPPRGKMNWFHSDEWPQPKQDVVGSVFGRLTVVGKLEPRVWPSSTKTRKDALVLAMCECGVERVVYLKHLKSGASKSCGCLARERASERTGSKNPLYRHGLTLTSTYGSWRSMIRRCLDPNVAGWHRYGGRGISVCEEWLSFDAFYADMGDRPADKTLDRIDNDGNYTPDNCRWATAKEQRANQSPLPA